MTIYERTMHITITSDEWIEEKHLDAMIQGDLHNRGLSLVPSYFYADRVQDKDYGFQTITDKESIQEIYIDEKLAFTLEYHSEARLAVKGLEANGFVAESRRVVNTKEYDGWVKVRGRYFYADFRHMEGEYQRHYSKGPAVEYEEGVILCSEFYRTSGAYRLDFTITFETDDLTVKNKAEQMLVDVPLMDMKYIRRTIIELLERYSLDGEVTVSEIECASKVISEAKYECSTESIDKVMKDAE